MFFETIGNNSNTVGDNLPRQEVLPEAEKKVSNIAKNTLGKPLSPESSPRNPTESLSQAASRYRSLSLPESVKAVEGAAAKVLSPNIVEEIKNELENARRDNFIMAISNNEINKVKAHIQSGIELNFIGKLNFTPLIAAARYGNIETFNLILSVSDANMGNSTGFTPLMSAVEANQIDKVKLLLDHKVDVDVKNQKGWNAMMGSLQHADTSILRLILKNLKASINDECRGWTPLVFAISKKNEAAVRVLLTHGANPNLESHGWIPLFIAAKLGLKDSVYRLLENGADIHATDSGRCIINYIKSLRTQNWKEIKIVVKKILKARGELTPYTQDYHRTKMLSHIYSLVGKSDFGPYKIYWEGGDAEIQAASLAKCVKKFSKHFPEYMSESIASELSYNLELASEYKSNSAAMLLKRIQQGYPTFILSGFKHHATAVLIWKNRIAVCNRGAESEQPLLVTKFDPKNLTEEILQSIRDVKALTPADYRNVFSMRFGSVLSKMGCRFFDDFTGARIEGLANLKMQKVGNCARASVEGVVKSYLYLAAIAYENLEEIENTEKLQRGVEGTYDNFLFYNQMDELNKYLSKMDPAHRDDALLQKCFTKLWEEFSAKPEKYDQRLKRIMDKLEASYLAECSEEANLLMRCNKVFHFYTSFVSFKDDITDKPTLNDPKNVLRGHKSDYGKKIVDLVQESVKAQAEFLDAINLGDVAIINDLTFKGVDVNIGDSSWSPMTLAIDTGNLAIVDALLDNGADLYQKNSQGLTAITYAIHSEKWDILQFFVDKDADLEEALDYAHKHNCYKALEILNKINE